MPGDISSLSAHMMFMNKPSVKKPIAILSTLAFAAVIIATSVSASSTPPERLAATAPVVATPSAASVAIPSSTVVPSRPAVVSPFAAPTPPAAPVIEPKVKQSKKPDVKKAAPESGPKKMAPTPEAKPTPKVKASPAKIPAPKPKSTTKKTTPKPKAVAPKAAPKKATGSFKSRARTILAKHGCGSANLIIDDKRLGKYSNGAADLYNHDILLRSAMPAYRLEYVAAHECMHVRQSRAYGGNINALEKATNKVWGGKGYTGLERAADCMTRAKGIKVVNKAYSSSCTGKQATATKKLLAGKRI